MKKLTALLLAIAIVFSFCGCSLLSNITSTLVDDVKLSEADMYSELDRIIGYTDALERTELTGEFTFCAMIYDEGEEVTFEEEDYTGFYYSAGISRNWDDYFLLDTMGLDTDFKDGDIVKVTGSTDGTIYWTEENDRVEVLSIKATAVEKYTPEDVEPTSDAKITLEDGNIIEFVGAHATKDTFGKAAVVYFNFTNNGSDEDSPSLSEFYVNHADEEASITIMSLDELDASALRMGAGITEDTYAGKTQLYCVAYKIYDSVSTDEPIYYSLYDDEFRCTYDLAVPIAASLAEMNK